MYACAFYFFASMNKNFQKSFKNKSIFFSFAPGPRRIFTPRAVFGKVGGVHMVKFGRVGRQAWLQVDSLENVTGSSPGRMIELNTKPTVYIGELM